MQLVEMDQDKDDENTETVEGANNFSTENFEKANKDIGVMAENEEVENGFKEEKYGEAIEEIDSFAVPTLEQAGEVLNELGNYKDSERLKKAVDEKIADVKEKVSNAEEEVKESKYVKAVNNLHKNKYKQAIKDLESLDDYKDSGVLIDRAKYEYDKKKKNQIRKMKIGLVITAIVVALVIAVLLVKYFTKVNLYEGDEFNNTKKYSIHNMSYEMPKDWTVNKDHTDEVKHYYEKEKDGELIAIAEIFYAGEDDLEGDAEYVAYKDYTTGDSDYTYTSFEQVDGIYYNLCSDHSEFVLSLYYEAGSVRGEEEFLEDMYDKFKIDEYNNPRKLIKTKVDNIKYVGKTTAGTLINENDITADIDEVYDTGIATGTKAGEFILKDEVTLEAGKTSTVTIIVEQKEYKLDVRCTTESPEQYKAKCENIDYKSQLREENIGSFIKISGQVLQDCGDGYYRISSNGDWDDVYFVHIEGSNVVEEDHVTVYGETSGIYTYETVLGATQKVPSIEAKYVDMY